MIIIYQDLCLDYFFRKNCFSCSYAERNRISDITIADFWGCKSTLSEMNENLGVSLMLINTVKGLNLFNEIKEKSFMKKDLLRKLFLVMVS